MGYISDIILSQKF